MIAVRDLRVDYDDVCAVRDISLEIADGEIFGLIGPNGAGKTTTLRALAGLLEPTYGDILLNGIDISTHREEAVRTLGFMPDSTPLYEDITVEEYLDLFAASYGIAPGERSAAIAKYLALVDLAEKRKAMTAGLSRGMKQRLLLAKTLLPEPRIVLLDEPASGMDPHGRALLRDILRQLGAEGRTVIISSHILVELSEFCTSVGVMQRGSMVVSGQVEEIAARLTEQRVWWVEVLEGEMPLLEMLDAHPLVGSVSREGDAYVFSFAGGRDEGSALLAALVGAGIRVTAFGRRKENLEELFLKIGAKEVS
jgi:ABC-2 type transport system ATP-binding protein